MTEQEVFDKVATHLLTQGKKAEDDGSCKYRAPDGCKCAVGALIPDELYTPQMDIDGVLFYSDDINNVGVIKVLRDQEITCDNLLVALQSLHDGEEVKNWKSGLVTISTDYCLSSQVLTQFNRPC